MNKWLYIFVVIMTSISNSAIFCDDIDPYIKTGYDKENVVRAIKEDRKGHFLMSALLKVVKGPVMVMMVDGCQSAMEKNQKMDLLNRRLVAIFVPQIG
ncbi:hypothetical protein [uncultured Fibrobacter sp.]|uniref:hypothetical protein n=1 Tax=uncultured Fibrobacter sp. TaxID=261512 RepID=UPI0025F8CF8B|nr:hypothetical protein [uncultured Fibrobacter sp.]